MTEKLWLDRGKFNKAKILDLSNKLGICPEVLAILDKRHINIESFFSQSFSLPNALLISDMDKGVDIVKDFCFRKEKIAIINDYDVDGATSGLIMDEAVRTVGADSFILTPKRRVDGYGMSTRLVDEAKARGASLIITTDNGISAFEAVSYAKSLNITVVVTDHHDIHKEGERDVLPDADAVIDAKRSDSQYPFKDICGAEVALKFACVLFARAGIEDALKKKLFRRFTELAAIGTVCDVMPLVEENRTLVKMGLHYMKASQIIGIRQLIREQKIEPDKITAFDIGFRIGPCINAMSRIYDDTDTVLRLFKEKDHLIAKSVAETLSRANEERKASSESSKIVALKLYDPSLPVSILYIPDENPAIMGIVAGKVREETGHPTVCLTDGESGTLKGSGRSPSSYNMFEHFSKFEDRYLSFGGHPGAIGITIDKKRLSEIDKLLNDDAAGMVFKKETIVDLFLSMNNVSERFIYDMEKMEPFGEGNPAPVLCDDTLYLDGVRRIGDNGKFIKLTLSNGKDAVYFGDADEFDRYMAECFGIPKQQSLYNIQKPSHLPVSFLYSPQFNYWNGNKTISFVIKDYMARG